MAKNKRYDDDDGRTVADMSGVERPGSSLLFPRIPEGEDKPVSNEPDTETEDRPWEKNDMSKDERLSYVLGAMSASALIAGIFILAGAIFIAVLLLLI